MTALAKPTDTPPAIDLARLQEEDTAALRRALAAALGRSAKHLLEMAAIWSELERRGEDLSDLRTGIAIYLPAIAIGAVLPETVIAFAGNTTLLRTVAQLSPEEQRRLAEGGTVQVVERQQEAGQYTHRMLPAKSLPVRLVRQVFGERHIRSEAEQIALIAAAVPKPKPHREPQRGRFRADRERGLILLGRLPLIPADLIAALADLHAPEETDQEAEAEERLGVAVTPAEHKRLKQRALDGNTNMQSLVRNALRAMGLI